LKSGDKVHETQIESDQNWTKLAESVETIDPDTLEVYAADGKLIRAAKRSNFEDPDGEEETENEAVKRIKAAADAETERFRIFSDHIAQAYRFATEVAFERMVDLFAAVNRRSESLEKSLEATHRLLGKAYQEQVDTALEQAENQDPLSNLVGAFVQGSSQAAMEQAVKVAPNAPPPNGSNGKAQAKA
jgi:hypothetical protein